MKSAKKIRKLLRSCISAVDLRKSEFCINSEKDFSRNRKLTFETMIMFILSMTCHSLPTELRNYFHQDTCAPTKSAFIQQRQKILPEAFRGLFNEFTGKIKAKKKFRGYRLLACDGTTVNLPRNPKDTVTSVFTKPKTESFNMLHVNALYDLMNNIYTDYTISLGIVAGEAPSMLQMASGLAEPEKTILVADRGYGFLTTVYRLSELKTNFVIRCKDIRSNSFLTAMAPSGEEFDVDISKIMTRSHKKECLNNPEYMVISGRNSLDFSGGKCYPVSFRACRFRLPSGGYECLITNLPRTEFTVSDLKQIYGMRWGIETSFRDLKYSVGLMYFHSKKLNSILQEIHAAMIMMNYCSAIIEAIPFEQKEDWKHLHRINFAAAVGCCISFLSSGETKSLNLILRDQSLIRPYRQYDRYLHDTKPAKPLTYRVS